MSETKLIFRKDESGNLVPVGDETKSAIQSLRRGEIIEAKISRPRNINHHRLFFAMLNLVLENQEKYRNTEDLLTIFCIATGHGRWIQTSPPVVMKKLWKKTWEFFEAAICESYIDSGRDVLTFTELLALLRSHKGKLMVAVPNLVNFQRKSISFGKMDQVEFNDFYDKCIEVMVKDVIPNLGSEELKAQAMEMIRD